MKLTHAIVWTDRHKAQILRFDAEHVLAQKVKGHSHHDRGQQAQAQTEQQFFDELCAALTGIKEVLVTGPAKALDEFRRHVGQWHPQLGQRILGYESAEHPATGHLLAFALQYFAHHDFVNSRR